MQLGTRWAVGAPVPDGLPEVVRYAVAAVEEELDALDTDTRAWRWTLTWLEKDPEIELDDGTRIQYNRAEDSATITQPAESLPNAFDDEFGEAGDE
ncbi:hypothetical protein [Rathayibacter soli]|uniref:hypothetical protein n=1 Tax=Rathayibacter soli TaxID=3144168 RepID=UPI0027E56D11|nr:hypothetical protein [Glaciibacter superstes]